MCRLCSSDGHEVEDEMNYMFNVADNLEKLSKFYRDVGNGRIKKIGYIWNKEDIKERFGNLLKSKYDFNILSVGTPFDKL